MKRVIQSLFFIFIFLGLGVFRPAFAETYQLDSQHTYVLWKINHLGFSTQAGKWYASGLLALDKNNPSNSSVNATIQVADIVTGIPELDKHLKSEAFFDVKRFPTASFVSNKVEVINASKAKVYGLLTLHGVAKPVTLDVSLVKSGMNPISNKMTVGFSATTQIKRSDFGIKTYLPVLGDEISLQIEAEASPAK